MRSTTTMAVVIAAALTFAACGGDEDTAGDSTVPTTWVPATSAPPQTTTTVSEPTIAPGTVPHTTVPHTTVSDTTVPSLTLPPTTVIDEAWRDQVDEFCMPRWLDIVALPAPADQADLEAYAQVHREAWDSSPDTSAIELPPGPGRTPADLARYRTAQQDAIDKAVAAAAADDHAATVAAIDAFRRHLGLLASAFAAAGQSCGPADADVAANAALNVSMLAPWQLETGFGSVWVSQDLINSVARIDPDSGEVLARIPMPAQPGKLQPADGRMLVRTLDSYVAVDAATNAIVGRLLKADVGPNANRSWAVDGAMWICDGQRLHRYDPTTLEPVAMVQLDIDCGQVHATKDLAVAWTYNEDPGESGNSRATFVDPRTNSVLGAVELAADAGVPIVLDDAVFFPHGTTASVVDRSSWAVTATPDFGRLIADGSQSAHDGTSIYTISDKANQTIAVIDPTTFEVTGEIRAIGTAPSLNSVAATPGVLWAVNNSGGLLQRFDIAG